VVVYALPLQSVLLIVYIERIGVSVEQKSAEVISIMA